MNTSPSMVARRSSPLPDLFSPPPSKPPQSAEEVAAGVDAWTEGKVEQRTKVASKPKQVSNASMERAAREVGEFLKTGEWSSAKPLHFVALYAWLHRKVYGVDTTELTPTTRLHACAMVALMLRKEFDGEQGKLADFMRWVWVRETEREKWRRENNRDGGSIGWRLQFATGNRLVVEYRLSLARKGEL